MYLERVSARMTCGGFSFLLFSLLFFCLSNGFNIPCQHAIPEKVLVSPEVRLSVDFSLKQHVFPLLPPLQRVRVIAYVFIVLSFWLM